MKIKYIYSNIKMLLILPLCLFMLSFGTCSGEIIAPEEDDDATVNAITNVDKVYATRGNISFTLPSTFTYDSLDVYAMLKPNGTPVKVGTISNLSAGASVTYTVPGLVPMQEYKIYLVPPASASANVSKATDVASSALGNVEVDTELALVNSETYRYGWAMNSQIYGSMVFTGGFTESQTLGLGAAVLHNLSTQDTADPAALFDLIKISPGTYNSSLGQTSVMDDFNGDGILELVVGDPYWGDPQIKPHCGQVSYFSAIPTADISVDDASVVKDYGPDPGTSPCGVNENRLSKALTYDGSQYLIASCQGCTYGEAPCNNGSDCGACAAYDVSDGLNYLGLFHKEGNPGDRMCERAQFIDLNANGTMDFVYQKTRSYLGTNCIQLYYVMDGVLAEGSQIFLQDIECGDANIAMSVIDANQDGIDDLALSQFSAEENSTYQLTVILGYSGFDPSATSNRYTFTGTGLGGFPLVEDFNNDGLKDFTIMNLTSWLIWLDAANADLSAAADFDIPLEEGLYAVSYDVNSDGYVDLVRSACNIIYECNMYIGY